ncbi:hypothetical protein [Streptomyces sp. NPDC056401]|uniref:hypothetical protein n=1 Tax=Streptomyces sp. NPDC056401 TaxID=3345809 RepID=UPI0035DC27C6
MDEQGGAGGVPKRDRRGEPHTDRRDGGTTPAADTDEASRLDRPQQPEKPGGKPGRKGTRWVGPRDE